MKNGLAMAAASAIPLLASGILAATGPGESMLILNIALVLVELGWNFGLISGTAIFGRCKLYIIIFQLFSPLQYFLQLQNDVCNSLA